MCQLLSLVAPKCASNSPAKAGKLASKTVFFGGDTGSRYAVRAIHTRFDAVQWFVTDACVTDEATGLAAVIRQNDDFETAVAGLD